MKKLGPYQFEGMLGRGGMGSVFKGRHIDTGEIHAVKVLAPVYSHDDHFRGRFESEIKALLQLDHPNIVKLISYGQEDGNLFFAMELVEGNSLFQMQKKGHQFNWRECLQVAKDVCLGLRHAHDRGIIHRDLKPGNLLMTEFRTVKLTDFGIAKAYGSNQNTGDNVLGTMDFMSPEQARGEPVTFRSDLYSLGTVLFTLLSGRPPFTANSIEESLRNLTRVPAPRIGSVVPGIPFEIEEIIARLMEKKPEKRVPTALALHHKLEDIEHELKTYSEAKTAETSKTPAEESRTLDLDPDMATIAHFTDHPAKGSAEGRRTPPADLATRADRTVVEESRSQVEIVPSRKGREDFFNRVTERKGADSKPDDTVHNGKGALKTLLMLLGVVALGAVLYLNSTRVPTADELYTRIQSSNAQAVLEECEQFVENYPEDPRIEMVNRTYKFGKATKYFNQLKNRITVKSKLIGDEGLTAIEKQFLDIATMADSDFESANILMDAFIKVHGPNPNLTERDRECVAAAKSFQLKIQQDAVRQAKTSLDSIRFSLKRALGQEPKDAALTYRSIIDLYGSMNEGRNPEVRELVDKARSRLQDVLDGKHPKPETPASEIEKKQDE